MALKITNNSGIYELFGNVEGNNVLALQNHFERLMTSTDKMILSLEHVRKIDSFGAQVLTKLYRSAIKNNKIFCLIGGENDQVNKAFGKVNYILRSDFI